MWLTGDIIFDLDAAATEHPLVTITCRTPLGDIRILGEVVSSGRLVLVADAHIEGAAANRLGVAGLIALARAFLETIDADELIVQGAVRTTGRGAGRRPRSFRYRHR